MGEGASDFVEYVKEQLAPLRRITNTRFFGGVGLVSEGVQFGMVMDSALYFVVDATTRPHYEKLGSACFSYETKKGRVNVKRYFEVPAPAIEDADQLIALARQAIGIAGKPVRARAKAAP